MLDNLFFPYYTDILIHFILYASILNIDKHIETHFRSMLELAQSLILNEEALNSLPENKRPVFIYEWLCFLNKVLVAAQKVSLNSILISNRKFFL